MINFDQVHYFDFYTHICMYVCIYIYMIIEPWVSDGNDLYNWFNHQTSADFAMNSWDSAIWDKDPIICDTVIYNPGWERNVSYFLAPNK